MALPIYFLLRDTQEDVKEITLQELNHISSSFKIIVNWLDEKAILFISYIRFICL